jgi:hypothetical protein
MKWALIATQEQPLTIWIDPVGQYPTWTPGRWETITASPGTIINIIIYDGISDYTPPEGTIVQEVPEEAKIGDTGYQV